jgi:hypothetical protein
MTRITRFSSQAEGDFVGLLMKQVEVASFDRALMLQAATSKVGHYRSTILASSFGRRPAKRHPWFRRQTPDIT